MFDLARESFAKHGDSFFLEESECVLIISKALLKKRHEDIQKKRRFLFSQKQEVLSGLVAQLQATDTFSLTQHLPNEIILLTEKTTVTMSNIEISEKVFFVLLEKTKVAIGERFSITKNIDNEDCIREHGMARETPICLERYEAGSSLVIENIERMSPSSIGCSLKEVLLHNTGLINILPKLRIKRDWEAEYLGLNTKEKEHVAGILEQGQTICFGRVKSMWLSEYAVSVVTKLSHEDFEVEELSLHASRKKHVAAVLEQEKPFCVGRVKSVWLECYAVSLITKMIIHEDNTMESFVLDAGKKHFSRILKKGDSSIELGRIRSSGFRVPKEIRRKLRYTLVDEEGKEMLEGERP
ncbi:MAG: uncharacterized protein A8A55_1922 [Amphiamblys sp. WSBS2006]|nr:MAG: uncharacterized protein A8A55_1922 [Amphiamblys sp. WSBS2006]